MKYLIAIAILVCAGCKAVESGCGSDPIVHPTDEQKRRAAPGAETKDPPYTPWWVELGF